MGVHDPARDEGEGVLLLSHDDRVAGVVAALEAHHDIGMLGEVIGDAAFAFIAPLGTQDHC